MDRGKHLVKICTNLEPIVFGKQNCIKSNGLISKSEPELIRFEFKRPATFTVANSMINNDNQKSISTITNNNRVLGSNEGCGLLPNQGYILLTHEFDATK